MRKGRLKRRSAGCTRGCWQIRGGWKPRIDALMFERLEEVDVEGLKKPFLEEEVFGALSGCCGEKAPGLDGFSMAF